MTGMPHEPDSTYCVTLLAGTADTGGLQLGSRQYAFRGRRVVIVKPQLTQAYLGYNPTLHAAV